MTRINRMTRINGMTGIKQKFFKIKNSLKKEKINNPVILNLFQDKINRLKGMSNPETSSG